MGYKNLIFDLDDTLLDFTKGEMIGLEKILRHHGISNLSEAVTIYKEINQKIWQDIENGADRTMLLNTRFAQLFAHYGQNVNGVELEREYRHFLNTNYHVILGAEALLKELKDQEYYLIVGTNGVRKTQEQRLEHTHLAPYFDAVFSSEEVGYAKPAHEFFDTIMKTLQLDKSETVMIGDGLTSDIQGASQYDMDSIWVNLKHQKNKTPYQANAEVHDLST